MLTPYSFFGLGRTNNYIENLFVGSTKHTPKHWENMEGVIPNSRVVILPPSTGESAWKKELFLRPGEWIPWVTLTSVVATLLLAVIAFVLHLNEKVCVVLIGVGCACELTLRLPCRGRMSWRGGGSRIASTLMHYDIGYQCTLLYIPPHYLYTAASKQTPQ